MANVILDQFAHLKQPACNYLSQVYEISYQLNDLIEALAELLFAIRPFIQSSHNLLDKNLIPVFDFEALYLCQAQAVEVLRTAADELESYKGFETYSAASAQMEVAHG